MPGCATLDLSSRRNVSLNAEYWERLATLSDLPLDLTSQSRLFTTVIKARASGEQIPNATGGRAAGFDKIVPRNLTHLSRHRTPVRLSFSERSACSKR